MPRAALIPSETDEEMALVRTREACLIAYAEAGRAKAVLDDAAAEWAYDGSPKTVARHIFRLKKYGDVLLDLAETETELHLATMPPPLAADLERSLESLEIFEG